MWRERTKKTVTTAPRMVGAPKSHTKCGSVITAETAKFTTYARPTERKRFIAERRPRIFGLALE